MKKYFTNLKSALLLSALGLTAFESVKAQSFTEGFDATSTLTDWYVRNNSDTIISTTHARNWGFGASTVFPAQAGAIGSYLAANWASTNSTATTGATISNWLFTPSRVISNGDVISFYTRTGVNPTTFEDRLEVRLSTTGAGTNVGTTSASVGDFTTLLLSVNPTLSTTGYPAAWTQYTVTISGLPSAMAGRVAFRYFVPDGGTNGANSDYIGVDTYSYTSMSTPPANDNCAGATNLIQGATCTPTTGTVAFATQSQAACGDGNANDDVWFKFTATTNGANITVDGSTGFDGVFEVFSGTCGALTSIACVDNTIDDGVETTTLNTLAIGQTYYVRVFDWYGDIPTTPDFTICVTEFTQCSLTQPAGSILETETCGQDLNGGCNMVPTPAYQTLTCGQTVFGTGWNNGTNKDTDWYSFTIATPGTATFTATAEFPFQMYFLNIANCASPVALATASSSACQSATITYNFTTAGTYVAFIAPSGFSGYACGTNNDYIATLTLPSTTPVITPAGATQICVSSGASVVLNASGTGTYQWYNGTTAVGTGTSSYTATAAGDYTVQLTNGNGCAVVSAPVSVTATPLDNATFAYPSNTICDGSANVTPTTSLAGTFSATPAGLVFVSTTTGEIDVAGSTLGTYTVTYNTNVACANSTTQTVTITAAPEAGFTYSAPSFCGGSANPSPVFAAGASAGTFSSTTGLSINSATGEINIPASTPGTYTVTNSIAASGSCPAASATATVSIFGQPTAVVSGGGNICGTGTSTVTITLAGAAPYNFTYTDGTNPTTVTGHAAGTYTITATATGTYTVTAVSDANCSNVGTGSAQVTVFANPTVSLAALPIVCSNGAAITLNQGTPAGGSYSGTGVTGSTFTPSAAGTSNITYDYIDGNGCTGSATGTITVEAAPTVALTALADVCSYVSPFALSGGTPAGGTYSGPGVTAGNFNPATAGVGTHTIVYTYANTSGAMCASTASKTILVKNCAGLDENELNNSLVVYPNPTHETVTVSFQTTEALAVEVSMISLDGKTVFAKQIPQTNQFSQEINVVGFPAGVYLIQIETVNGSATRRLIVQ